MTQSWMNNEKYWISSKFMKKFNDGHEPTKEEIKKAKKLGILDLKLYLVKTNPKYMEK